MEKIKYPIREIDLKHIKSNRILAANICNAEIDLLEKNIRQHGLLTPVVLLENSSGEQITVCGEKEIQALRNMGVSKTDVIVSELKSKGDVGKITLLMSGMKKGLSPITEGLILKEMIMSGFTQKELAYKLQKSQGWVSKRLSIAHSLKETVVNMVLDKKLCSRSAEEIAKLPQDKQHEFAIQSCKLNLSKSSIEKLISVYRNKTTGDTLKNEIIANPARALLYISDGTEAKKVRASINSEQKLDAAIRFLLKLIGEIEGYTASVSKETFEKYKSLIGATYSALKRFTMLIGNLYVTYQGNSLGNNESEV